MKKKIVYSEEPKDGMELPQEGFAVLGRAREREVGLPDVNPAGTEYDRRERAGVVTLTPRRGGRRKGAGRKATGHVRMQLLVSPATRRKIEELAKRQKVTLSEAVEQMAASKWEV